MHRYNVSMFKHTKKFTFAKTIIEISIHLIGKEISIWFNDLCRNICILASFVYIQSFNKFNNNFTGISFSRSKTCIKTLSFNIYNAGVIFEIAECFFKWVITFIVHKIWNTWNLKFLDCFWKKVTKNSTQFTMGWNSFIFLS